MAASIKVSLNTTPRFLMAGEQRSGSPVCNISDIFRKAGQMEKGASSTNLACKKVHSRTATFLRVRSSNRTKQLPIEYKLASGLEFE